MPQWCPGKVTAKRIWTEGLFTVTIECPGVLPFDPGQFLHLAVCESDDKLCNRPYSVASPHGSQLQFFIVLVDDGKLTPRLWDLQVGAELQVSQKAAGRFTLNHTPRSKSIWLFATGTGLAPYIAMLRDRVIWEEYPKIVVAHGVRHLSDLAYAEELRGYQNEFPDRFRYIPSATRESSPDVLQGRLPSLVAEGRLEQKCPFPLNAEQSTVMLCGNPAMLESMVEVLESRGMKEHRRKFPGQIVVERYW